MASTSLPRRNGWSNHFFLLSGVLTLSLSYKQVKGRCFWFGGPPLPDHEVPRWKGGDPAEEQPNRIHPLPAEDKNPLERVAHAANASTIRSVHTTDFTHMAPTTELVVLTSASATPPYVQLASELFSDFRSASATVQSHTSFFVGGSRDLVERYLPIVSNREGIV